MLCIPGILGQWHSLGSRPNFPYWASFWLTDFGRLAFSFSLWNFKAFSLHGDPNSLDFFHSSLLFFFLSSLQDNPMCYFSLGLGLWLILNLNSFKGSNYLLIVTHVYFHQLDILNINTKMWTVVECLLSTFNSAVSFYKLAFEHACECILRG